MTNFSSAVLVLVFVFPCVARVKCSEWVEASFPVAVISLCAVFRCEHQSVGMAAGRYPVKTNLCRRKSRSLDSGDSGGTSDIRDISLTLFCTAKTHNFMSCVLITVKTNTKKCIDLISDGLLNLFDTLAWITCDWMLLPAS